LSGVAVGAIDEEGSHRIIIPHSATPDLLY